MLSNGSIDLGRERGGISLGLRDGALFALLAAGLGFTDIASLKCDAIRQDSSGRLRIRAQKGPWECTLLLGEAESARVLAWIMELRAWGTGLALFGPSRPRLQRIVKRYLERAAEGRRRAAW